MVEFFSFPCSLFLHPLYLRALRHAEEAGGLEHQDNQENDEGHQVLEAGREDGDDEYLDEAEDEASIDVADAARHRHEAGQVEEEDPAQRHGDTLKRPLTEAQRHGGHKVI